MNLKHEAYRLQEAYLRSDPEWEFLSLLSQIVSEIWDLPRTRRMDLPTDRMAFAESNHEAATSGRSFVWLPMLKSTSICGGEPLFALYDPLLLKGMIDLALCFSKRQKRDFHFAFVEFILTAKE